MRRHEKALEVLRTRSSAVRFADLERVCRYYFGELVRQVLAAVVKLRE